jgi:hypothetical protein
MTVTTETIRLLIQIETEKALESLKRTDASAEAAKDILSSLGETAKVTSGMYTLFGNETKYLESSQNELKSAIQKLISEGFHPQSKEVQELKTKYDAYESQLDSLRASSKRLDDANVSLSSRFASLRDIMQGPIAAAERVINGMGRIEQGAEALLIAADGDREAFALLNAAFVASGDFSGKAAIGIAGLAAVLQTKTGIDEDNIRTTGAMLRSIVGLNEEGIKKLIPSLLDFQVAAGKDSESAVRMLAATIEGGADSLKRYGISVENCRTDQEKLEKISTGLNEKFGGTAEAAFKAKSGLEGMKLQAGELKEALGKLLESKGGKELISTISIGLEGLTKRVSDFVDNSKLDDILKKTFSSGKTNLSDFQKYMEDSLVTSTELIDKLQNRSNEKKESLQWYVDHPNAEYAKTYIAKYKSEALALDDIILRMKDKSLWDDKAIEAAKKEKADNDQKLADQEAINLAYENMKKGLRDIDWQKNAKGDAFDAASEKAKLLNDEITKLEGAGFTWDPKGSLNQFYREFQVTCAAISDIPVKVNLVPSWKAASRLKEDYGETDEIGLKQLLDDKATEQAVQEKLNELYAKTPEYAKAAKDETREWVEAQRSLAKAVGNSTTQYDAILRTLREINDFKTIPSWKAASRLKEDYGETDEIGLKQLLNDKATEQAIQEKLNELYAQTPEYAKATKEETIAWAEAQRVVAAAAGKSTVKYDAILKNLRGEKNELEDIANLIKNASIDSLTKSISVFGESLATGADASRSIVASVGSIGSQLAAQAGKMYITAGLSAIAANPYNPGGWGLLALGGISSFASGLFGSISGKVGSSDYTSIVTDPVIDAEKVLSRARISLLKDELDLEKDIRDKALADLKSEYAMEFDVLKDLWSRNLISTEEYRTQSATLRTKQQTAEDAITAPYDEIDAAELKTKKELIDAKKTKLAALQKELDGLEDQYTKDSGNWMSQQIDTALMKKVSDRISKVKDATTIEEVAAAKNGADFITSGPQLLLVGDNPSGAEHVRIEPLPSPRSLSSRSQGKTIIIQGDVYGIEDFRKKLQLVEEKSKGRGR